MNWPVPSFGGAGRKVMCLLPLALMAACASGGSKTAEVALVPAKVETMAAPAYFKTVSAQGADFTSVQAAIDAVPAGNAEQKIIYIQPGKYLERVVLNKPHVTLRGASDGLSVVSSHLGFSDFLPDGAKVTWQTSCAIYITANDAVLEDLTVENTHGPGTQALACGITGDRAVFRRCRITGYQDTLRPESGRHYFDHCFISGATDFIYGAGTSYFDQCEINVVDNGYLTAASTRAGKIGFVFQDCKVTLARPGLTTYLGRPWEYSSSTTFIHTALPAGLQADGWKDWNVAPADRRYAEYQSYGPGANDDARVKWATASAGPAPEQFSLANVFGDWNPDR